VASRDTLRQKTAQASDEIRDASSQPSQSEIELRAYSIFLGRGSTDGHDLDDWLQAEQELSYVEPRPVAKGQSA